MCHHVTCGFPRSKSGIPKPEAAQYFTKILGKSHLEVKFRKMVVLHHFVSQKII